MALQAPRSPAPAASGGGGAVREQKGRHGVQAASRAGGSRDGPGSDLRPWSCREAAVLAGAAPAPHGGLPTEGRGSGPGAGHSWPVGLRARRVRRVTMD